MKHTNILLIGAGNVATNIAVSFHSIGIRIVGIYSKTIETSNALASLVESRVIENLNELPEHDFIIVCVPDDIISSVISQLPIDAKIAYTSGTVSLQSLPNYPNLGVFYPLQTFTKEKMIDLKTVPFFIEANNSHFEKELFELALHLGKQATTTNSEQRKQLHIAAVFVNNFTNHLAYIAKEHLEKNDLNWENLLPLLEETLNKIKDSNPKEIQTGPARRNDLGVLKTHLNELTGDPETIYKAITDSIIHTYHA